MAFSDVEFNDYYQIMGVPRDSTQDDIKRAYRKLARKYHPDVSTEPDAEARFKEVGEAYEVLKDAEKRAAYDHLGPRWKAGQDFHPPPDWQEGFEFHGGGFTGGDASGFSDFFESLFGRGGPGFREHQGMHARGADSHARIHIDLEDAYRGATRTVVLKSTTVGRNGRPQVSERTLNVRIPKGVREGQHIRLSGQGGQGLGGAQPGDQFLEIAFKPHAYYHVEGRDVFVDLPVAPWEAALGATVKTPTPTGAVDLKIPAGTQPGRRLRLKGRGIPGSRSGDTAGDLYVVVQIALPPADTESARAAYQKMKDALDFNPRARLEV